MILSFYGVNVIINDLLYLISKFIDDKIPKKYSISFQEILLVSGIFNVASEVLAILIIL